MFKVEFAGTLLGFDDYVSESKLEGLSLGV